MLLFDHLEIRCEKCFESFKCLEFAKHEAKCGRKSSIFASIIAENEIQEQSRALPFHASSLLKARTPKPKMKKKLKADPTPLSTPLVGDNHAIQVYQDNHINQPSQAVQESPSQTVQIEQKSCGWYFWVTLIGFITLTIMWVVGFFGIKWIFLDSNLTFKWICIGNNLFEENQDLCFFSLGQFSIGIIAIGQLGVGVFTLAQAGIGLLFGVGQAIGGCGVTMGQLALSFYVYLAMVGAAFYRTKFALGGIHSFYSLKTSKSCFTTG